MYFDDDPSALLDNFPYLGEELSFANYKDKFANLLYLEEMEQTEQMTQFRLVMNWYFFFFFGWGGGGPLDGLHCFHMEVKVAVLNAISKITTKYRISLNKVRGH